MVSVVKFVINDVQSLFNVVKILDVQNSKIIVVI